uniref:Serpentine receptor class gamma n=1 Tax=Globodera rostochiensis TaxID=31243 RepID=A0A914H925_GLORO
MDFVDWSISIRNPSIYLAICITIPSMALYIAEIVTIVRHKQFHNSFYALFVMRAIPDWLGVLNSFYAQRLPSIIGAVLYPIYLKFPNWMLAMDLFLAAHTFQANNLATILILLNRLTAIIMPIKHEKMWRKFLPLLTMFVFCVPILTCWPAFKENGIIQLNNPNSTTDRSFSFMTAEGDAPYLNYIIYIDAIFSIIFTIICVLLNIFTFVAYKLHVKKVSINGNNNGVEIEKKLLVYALATFLGHALVTSLLLIQIISNMNPKTITMLIVYYPLITDIGTVVISSWLLLWASGTFRQQLIKNFVIIRFTDRANIRVVKIEGPQNNNDRAFGGAVGHQLQNRIAVPYNN